MYSTRASLNQQCGPLKGALSTTNDQEAFVFGVREIHEVTRVRVTTGRQARR